MLYLFAKSNPRLSTCLGVVLEALISGSEGVGVYGAMERKTRLRQHFCCSRQRLGCWGKTCTTLLCATMACSSSVSACCVAKTQGDSSLNGHGLVPQSFDNDLKSH